MQLEEFLKIVDSTKSFLFRPKYKMLDEIIAKEFESLGFKIIYLERLDCYLAKLDSKTKDLYDFLVFQDIIRKYQNVCYFEGLSDRFKIM